MQAQGRRSEEVAAGLLRGLQAGSSQAWARLCDQLAPGIQRFAVSCLSADAETAEDIVVETLAHAARGISRFDPEKASLAAWLYGIARHCIQGELRRRARHKSVPAWAQVSLEDLAELSESEDLGARTAARLDAQRRIQEAVGLLSESEQELLALSAVEELPEREIAAIVGRSPRAVNSLIGRARQKVRRTRIEGTLLVGGTRPTFLGGGRAVYAPFSQWFAGDEDRMTGWETGVSTEVSPVSDEIAYTLSGPGVQEYPAQRRHIWKAKLDGSEAVDLTEQAGVGGLNMYPRWSPDGSMIAFVRWDSLGAELAGPGEAWVVKADGSTACRAALKEVLPAWSVAWSRDGSCLLCQVSEDFAGAPPLSVDLWGKRVRVMPEPYWGCVWSPDRSRIAGTRHLRGDVEGEPGYWNQLVVVRADGSHPKVIAEQFFRDAWLGMLEPAKEFTDAWPAFDWKSDERYWAGPVEPRWSPTGDKIAFLAALPFDPHAPPLSRKPNVWVYGLLTKRLSKITHEPTLHHSLSWR